MHVARVIRWFAVPLVLFSASLFAQVAVASDEGQPIDVQGGPWLLAGRAFESRDRSRHPRLIVVLHGDAPFGNPTYHYRFSRDAAATLNDVVVVGLLRPGYKDGIGGQSQGNRGYKNGDNYTPENIASIASAAKTLIDRYHATELVLVGHSGGSAIAADILARDPHLARGALLVSCPCDVPAFRWSMLKHQWNPVWLLPVNTVSPQDQVAGIPKDTIIRMVVGSTDPVTPASLTAAFAQALKARGNNVQVVELKDQGHEILLEPAVLEQLRLLMNATSAE